MDNAKGNLLGEFDSIAIVVGFCIGVGVLSLPNSVTKVAKQDGWIAVIIGGLYPLFMALLSIYYVKKYPDKDILALGKKYLGNVLGTICNILFMAQFYVHFIAVNNGFNNIYRVYATSFLTPMKIFIPTILLAIYLSYKGLKVLTRINKIAFYFTVLLMMTLIIVIPRGNYLNLLPIFGSGYKSILKGSLESAYAYGGIEGIFLIYPFMRNKDRIKAVALKATFIIIMIYTWVTFASIYYLGYKLTTKTLWPVLLITEVADLPLINSFRLVFLFLWSIVIFKVLANEQYAIKRIISSIVKVKEEVYIYYFMFPVSVYLCLKLGSEAQRRAFLDFIIPKATLFNIAYVLIIGLLIFINDKTKKEISL